MINRSSEEAKKRKPHITHHFTTSHLTNDETDTLGFLGEFAACSFLEIDWESNIRENYLTIDSGDGSINGKIFDVKSETIPERYLSQVINRTILDNQPYGRRWINENQIPLLHKYDIIIFGAFARNDLTKWYPIGWIDTEFILNHCPIVSGNMKNNTTSHIEINTSDLNDILLLKQYSNTNGGI